MANLYCENGTNTHKVIGFEEYLVIAKEDDAYNLFIKVQHKEVNRYNLKIKALGDKGYHDGFDLGYSHQPMR